MTSAKVTLYVLAVGSLLLVLNGCDNTIEPFAEETGLFSVYGYLDLDEPENYIRVRDLNHRPVSDSILELDATVTLTQPESGYSETLEANVDEVEGGYVHNFKTDVDLEYETTYHLRVERSDGEVVSTSATLPHEISTSFTPADKAGDCLNTFTASFIGESRERRIQAYIGFRYRGVMRWVNRSVEKSGDNRLIVQFQPESLLEDLIEIDDDDHYFSDPDREHYYTPLCQELDDDRFWVRFTHYGPDWDGQNIPIDPLESYDVENGLGFFGGLRTDDLSVTVDTSDIFIPPF